MSLRACILKLSSLTLSASRHAALSLNRSSRHSLLGIHGSRNLIIVARDHDVGVAKQLKDTGAKIDDAIAARNTDDLRDGLGTLRKLVWRLPGTDSADKSGTYLGLTPSKVVDIINIYAGTGREEDAISADHLLYDCVTVFSLPVSADALSVALQALVNTKQTAKADRLLRFFIKNTALRPSSIHWQIVMGGYSAMTFVHKLRRMIVLMKTYGPFPGRKHYRALMHALSRHRAVTVKEVKEVLDEMLHHKIGFDSVIMEILFRRASSDESWKQLAEEYHARLGESPIPAEQVQIWMKELVTTLESKGRIPFGQHLLRLQHQGFFCDEVTLHMILERANVASADTLKFLRNIMDVQTSATAWITLIKNALRKSGIRDAMSVYNAAKGDGIQPNASILRPLLHDLTSSRFRDSDDALDEALKLFADIDRESVLPDSEGARSDDTTIYNMLLCALAAASNTSKYFPIALEILEEMRKRNVPMDAMSTTSIAVMLIRSATSFDEAAEAYKLVTSKNKQFLDAKGFVAVLSAVCELEIKDPDNLDYLGRPQLLLPPPSLYYRIIQDMQDLGYPKPIQLYTTLLYRHGMLASRSRRMKDPKRRAEATAAMLDVIETTHREMYADREPETYGLTALLDAYNRVGSMPRVLEVWSLLRTFESIPHASVSVILDACGHNRAFDEFDAIYKDINDMNFPWNRRNYNALLECLCRLGRLDAALNFAFKDMAEHVDPDMRPDVETLRVLASFALQANRGKEILTQLKQRMPTLYEDLKRDKEFFVAESSRHLFAQV